MDGKSAKSAPKTVKTGQKRAKSRQKLKIPHCPS
jgi:hypothetical protein